MPHLKTTLIGEPNALELSLFHQKEVIEAWFEAQWAKTSPPFYCSVDLRNAGFKIAPVDTNLFPGGFNQLAPEFIPLCVEAVKDYMELTQTHAKKIVLVAESHTRNISYFENIVSLQTILVEAGFEVQVGTMLAQLRMAKTIPLPSKRELTLAPFERVQDRLVIGEFDADLVLLNNDLSEGIPEVLKNLKQPLIPSVLLGWSTRLKSGHFQHYQNVAHEFATSLNLDSWMFAPNFRYCGEINFMTREGEDCLVRHATALFKSIQEKYKTYGVKKEPFLVIKSDKGTYGMAVMMIKSPDEIHDLNRKERTRMSASKGVNAVSRVIIQEGVHTIETLGEKKAVAEPVVYMMGRRVVGGFYRVHAQRRADENLNAVGMHFEPMTFEKPEALNRFYSYSVVARLALVAAAREKAEALL